MAAWFALILTGLVFVLLGMNALVIWLVVRAARRPVASAAGATPADSRDASPAPAAPGAARRTSALATASLVLGIVSIVCCMNFLCGVPAVICGHLARRDIGRSGGALGGDAQATWGLVLGYIGVALGVAGALSMLPMLALWTRRTSEAVGGWPQIHRLP